MNKYLITFIVFACSIHIINAQQISGKLRDFETNKPIQNIYYWIDSVTWDGSSPVYLDEDGEFFIKISNDTKIDLIISAIGYGQLIIKNISASDSIHIGNIPLLRYQEVMGEWNGETGEHQMPYTVDNIENGIHLFEITNNCFIQFEKSDGVSIMNYDDIYNCLAQKK